MKRSICTPYKEQQVIDHIRIGKIQIRLISAFFLIALIPIILYGIYARHVYTESVKAKVSEYASQSVTLLNKVLTLELEKYTNYIDTLSIAPGTQELLNQGAEKDYAETARQLVEVSHGLASSGIQLRQTQIIGRDGQMLFSSGYIPFADTAYKSLLDAIDRSSTSDCLQYVTDGRSAGSLVIGRKLYNYAPTLTPKGYILVYINSHLIQDRIFSQLDQSPDSNVWIVDAEGTVLAGNNLTQGTSMTASPEYQQLLLSNRSGQSAFSVTSDGEKYLGVFSWNEPFSCYFVEMIPYRHIHNETKQITYNLTILALILLLVSFAIMSVIYASIVFPINRIVDYCRKLSSEDISQPIGDTNPDELGFLARTIDGMLERISTMVQEKEQDQLRKRQLELESLQYQINPHFLFNTLNTLKWVASLNDVPILYEGIDSLSALLQSTLMNKSDLLPLSEELSNLDHYFSIQRIRYGGSFEVQHSIDESLLEHQVPRFILQPLAENAIIHGGSDGDHIVLITVSACRVNGNVLELGICDNGKGFHIDTSVNRKERFSGIGIVNVDERIKLYYGSEYGVNIQSIPGQGTKCYIRLPLNTEKGGNTCG